MVKPHSEFADEHTDELDRELRSTGPVAAGRAEASDLAIHGHRIKELSPHPAVSVPPSAPAAKAIEEMKVHHFGCVLVVEDDRLVGIFTERDVLTKVLDSGKDLRATPVSEFMTPNPETLTEDDEIAYALNKMCLGGYRHIPILDSKGKPRFLLSVRDIVRYIVDLSPSAVLNLPPEPSRSAPKRDSGA